MSSLAMERYTSKKTPTDDKVRFIRHTRHTTEDLRRFGGLHAPPIGTSTRDITDAQDMEERLQDFNEAFERYCGKPT